MGILAQEVNFGKVVKGGKKMYSKVVGQNADGFFVINSNNPVFDDGNQIQLSGSKFEVCFYDFELSQKWLTAIELPFVDPIFENIFCYSNKVQVFFSTAGTSSNKNQLYQFVLNASDGNAIQEPVIVTDLEYDKKKLKGEFLVARSLNSEKLLAYSVKTNSETQLVEMNFKLMDNELKEINTLEFKSKYASKDFFLKQVQVDNNGNCYTLAFTRSDSRKIAEQQVFVLIPDFEKKIVREIPLSLGTSGISDMTMMVDNLKGRLVVSGLYSESNSLSSASGTFVFYINSSSAVIDHMNFQSFKGKFLNEFSSGGINRSNELLNYKVKNLILRSDGGAILIAESSLITESSNYNSYYQIYTTSYTYNYENVFIFSLSEDGGVDFEGILRKNQTSENDDGLYSSFTYLIDSEAIHFVYNKAIRKRSSVINFSINNKGDVVEKTLFKDGEDVFILPKGSKQVSQNELVIPCFQKGRNNLLKLAF